MMRCRGTWAESSLRLRNCALTSIGMSCLPREEHSGEDLEVRGAGSESARDLASVEKHWMAEVLAVRVSLSLSTGVPQWRSTLIHPT